MARSRVIPRKLDRGLRLISDALAGPSPPVGRGVPQCSYTRFMSPKSLRPCQRCPRMLVAERIGDGKASLTSSSRSVCIISCGVGSGCASGASCAQPCDVLYLVDDSPCVLLWGIDEEKRHESETNRKNSDKPKRRFYTERPRHLKVYIAKIPVLSDNGVRQRILEAAGICWVAFRWSLAFRRNLRFRDRLKGDTPKS
jgi:hypothetical protein